MPVDTGAALIIPDSEPFWLPGGRTGCLLLHGFTSTPEEMRPCGDFLRDQGFSVLGIRMAGHATYPEALGRTRWQDWLVSVEDGLAFLRGCCDRVALVGQSLGGMVALLAATRYPVDGVVAISTPYDLVDDWRSRFVRWWSLLIPIIHKGKTPISDPRSTRREQDYPAYPYFPTRALYEVEELKMVMRAALPSLRVPVLIIQSRDDPTIPIQGGERLFEAIGTERKELFWLEGADHSIVLDAQRELAFQKIVTFLKGDHFPS